MFVDCSFVVSRSWFVNVRCVPSVVCWLLAVVCCLLRCVLIAVCFGLFALECLLCVVSRAV